MCSHEDFYVTANIARLTKTEGGKVTGYMAEVSVKCLQCNTPFQFLGLEPGHDTQGARVSLDGLEANIAITPDGTMPNPLQRLAYDINKFES